jgi:hypothetical protein
MVRRNINAGSGLGNSLKLCEIRAEPRFKYPRRAMGIGQGVKLQFASVKSELKYATQPVAGIGFTC